MRLSKRCRRLEDCDGNGKGGDWVLAELGGGTTDGDNMKGSDSGGCGVEGLWSAVNAEPGGPGGRRAGRTARGYIQQKGASVILIGKT